MMEYARPAPPRPRLRESSAHGQGRVAHRLVDHLASRTGLVQNVGDELLAAETRVHRHEEDDVDLVHHVLEVIKGGGRVEHEAGLAASSANQGE